MANNIASNVIDLAVQREIRVKQKKQQEEEEVENIMPFAESSAELVAEFLLFCRKRRPTLYKFCDLLCDELKEEAEHVLFEMTDRLKKNLTIKNRGKKEKIKLVSNQKTAQKLTQRIQKQKKRIRTKRRRQYKCHK